MNIYSRTYSIYEKAKPIYKYYLIKNEARELRCKKCNKLLGKIEKDYKIGHIELKCTKCNTVNTYED